MEGNTRQSEYTFLLSALLLGDLHLVVQLVNGGFAAWSEGGEKNKAKNPQKIKPGTHYFVLCKWTVSSSSCSLGGLCFVSLIAISWQAS